jgi:hypothetical protein
LQEQVSAFPIGDLLRAQQAKHSRLWPLAAAAVLVAGVTTWMLQRGPGDGDGARPAAVSGHAPTAPAPVPVAPPARPTPTPPTAAATPEKPKPTDAPKAVVSPATKALAADGGTQSADSARPRATSNGKRRSKAENKRPIGVDTPDIPEPTSEPRREAAPPEPEPAPGKFIPEDI